ncbi:hypothetical protein [Streptosporangium sp. KLBMP 9127]|nr:hypothetical protein [Streptosporangium sp. KLBMP 9127]MCG5220793.1 hypothetical protein [Streptosporangium sp. KLBMP 9127]
MRRMTAALLATVCAGTAFASSPPTLAQTPGTGAASLNRSAAQTDWLSRLRAAMEKFKDPAVAERYGYVRTDHCSQFQFTGADGKPIGGMGYHYANQRLIQDPRLLPLQPEVLVYVPGVRDRRELGAIEYIKNDDDQLLATPEDRPSLFGREFQGPMEPHANGGAIHYDMHIWLFMHNPKGLFEPWNPRVVCPGGHAHS